MQRLPNYPLMVLLILAVSSVSAQFDDEGLRLASMARVVTHIERPADCIAPVLVTRIDGKSAAVSAKSFLIEPGVHRLNGKALLDLSSCPITDSRFRMSPAKDLEVVFDMGYTYYIGYYHKPENPDEWQLVVWNTEKSP